MYAVLVFVGVCVCVGVCVIDLVTVGVTVCDGVILYLLGVCVLVYCLFWFVWCLSSGSV